MSTIKIMKNKFPIEGDYVHILGTEYYGEIEEALVCGNTVNYKVNCVGFSRWVHGEGVVLVNKK